LNLANHALIASAAVKNDSNLAKSVGVAIFLKLVAERSPSKYDHRSFIIEKVVLVPREKIEKYAEDQEWVKGNFEHDVGEHMKLLVGFCRLPRPYKLSENQLWKLPISSISEGEDVLPPAFDLHRYITHVNRGITHFHASFWPLPRDISDAELEDPELQPPEEWNSYAWRHHRTISGLRGQGVVGIELPDGTRVPIYKVGANGHFRRCAPGETDTDGAEEFKKLLVDPSRMVRMLSGWLEYFTLLQSEFSCTLDVQSEY
jgi:hypothetical protein